MPADIEGEMPLSIAVTEDGYAQLVTPGAFRHVVGGTVPLTMDGEVIGEAVITGLDADGTGVVFSARVVPRK